MEARTMHTRKNGIVIDLGRKQHHYPKTKTVGFVELYNERECSWIITQVSDKAEIKKLVQGGYTEADAWYADVTA